MKKNILKINRFTKSLKNEIFLDYVEINKNPKHFFSAGFTIIETMISISIFLIVITIGMNALLNASFVHQRSKDQTSIINDLNFIMEDMSRNIRTGYNFRCVDVSFEISQVSNTPQNCEGGGAIVFENAVGAPAGGELGGVFCTECLDDQWVYFIESGDGTNFNIYKSVDGGQSHTQLNSSDIKLDQESGFYISGATTLDDQQPLVKIVLKGKIIYKNTDYPFSLQTMVSQRTLDV